ncbi:MAG TPA: TerC family protein [Candidatus Omnitrophota bacterium]|nr:TerC family protein [Candidatus Omnitrophota bacterium]
MMIQDITFWSVFSVLILGMMALDLGVHRKASEVKVKEALLWSALWIVLALLFNLGIYFVYGPQKAINFLTGYIIERALSIDNIFVFLLIFSYFRIPLLYQHKVLFWGILGAFVIRAVFIVVGVSLVERFHWILYCFGVFLIVTGIKLAFEKDKEIHPEHNPVLKIFKRFMPVTHEFHDGKFFVKEHNIRLATPLFIALLVVETTDIIFAVDSIPAVLAITTDPFIVYTSNIFAILGLRALYFALAGIMGMFYYLHYGLAFILSFIGAKMLLADIYKIPTLAVLSIIASVLTLSVAASLFRLRFSSKI